MSDTKQNKRAVGNVGESVACDFLVSNGYNIICRNYYCPYGEVDIIAENDRRTVFVEVKMRTESAVQKKYGRPANAVNAKKREHILKSVHHYIKEKSPEKPPRIDVIEILASKDSDTSLHQFKIKHIKAAFADRV